MRLVEDQPLPGMPELVTLERSQVAFLVAGTINDHLPAPDEGHSDEGCCNRCCGPCNSVWLLAESGQIDAILADYGPGHVWWDDTVGRVDRAWLAQGWRLTGCHDDSEEDA